MVPALHVTELPGPIEGLPVDRRGYIPTAETGPFDLNWDHGDEHTHYANGCLTEYGQSWQSVKWPEIVAEAERLMVDNLQTR